MWRAALILGVATAGAWAQAPPEITAIEFTGLARVDTTLVDQALRLHQGDPLRPYQIGESVRALYALGLFDQVAADWIPGRPAGGVLRFGFVERSPISSVSFRGHKFLSAEDLKEHATLTPGQLLSRQALTRAQRAIVQAYRDEGFARASAVATSGPDSTGEQMRVEIAIDEGPRVKIRDVAFLGASAFPQKELRGEVKLRPQGFLRKGRFRREQLSEDATQLQSFYRNHGYRDAEVTPEEPAFTPDGAGVGIAFRIREGPQYRFARARWTGVTVVDTLALQAATRFQPGAAFDQSKVDATLTEATNLYTERGYLTGLRIDPQPSVAGDSVQLTFQVTEGEPSQVGDIRIVGNTTTKERVIRRELSLYPGALLRRSLLLRSQRDVFATGFFDDVQVEFAPGTRPAEVDVTFRIKERSSITATAGAGYSSQVGLTGFVEFGHNNLFGNGQSVSLKLEHGGKRDLYDFSFTEPWVGGRPISAGLDLYKTDMYREIYAAGGDNGSYWQWRAGAGLRFGFPWMFRFPDYTRLSLGYSYTETKYREMEELPEETQALLREGTGTLSRTFVSLYRNSTDNPFHPTLGTRTLLSAEFNGGLMGGDMDYYRVTVDHRQYFSPFWKPVLMLRWRAGTLGTYRQGGRLPPTERFRLGGTVGFDYMRGYHDYYIVPAENIRESSLGTGTIRFPGGNVMCGFTSEVQFPIFDPVHGIIFMDAADTWNSAYDVTLSGLKFGAGAGITLEIPMLGPLGFYYAYGSDTREWMTHFAFGTEQ